MNINNKKVPIVMICDKNFVRQTCVALASLKMNKRESTIYEVHVIAVDCGNDMIELLEKQGQSDFSIRIIRVTSKRYKEIKQMAHVSSAALLKFEICDLLPQYNKLLYLDGDMLIRQDLSELYQTQLGDNYLACVVHSLGIVTGEKKLNSGLMLLHAAKIREEGLKDIFADTRESLGNRKSMDQETFHIVFGDKKILLDPKYNVMVDKVDYERKYYSIKEYNAFYGTNYKSRREIIDTAAVIHFTGSIKPWNYRFAKCGDEWRKYYKLVFGDESELCLKGRLEYYKEQFRKDGWKGIYWLLKDQMLGLMGGLFHIFPDKSHGEWN